MSDKLTIPALSDDENVTLNILIEQLDRKSRRNWLRSSYYDMRRVIRQVGAVIPAQYNNLGITLGWAAKGVDALARRVKFDDTIWPSGDIDKLGMPRLLEGNLLVSKISQSVTDSLVHGVSYLVTTRGAPGTDEPAALVHSKDALNATGVWNDRTMGLDNLLSVTSRVDDRITGFVLYLRNLTINAELVDGKWSVDRSEHTFGVPAEPLVYRPHTLRPMGRSRINRAVMSHQDSAVRALIRMEAHMDIYAIPKLMLLGADESIFKNADGSLKSSWQVVMGRVFGIPDDDDAAVPRADVKQFSAESPAPHLAELNALAKLMAREFDLPDSSFALTDLANPTSADAYSASERDFVAEAEDTQDNFDVPVIRTIRRSLAMQNGLSSVPDEWSSMFPKWRPAAFVSRAAAADAGAKQLSVIPWLADTEVGLELLGLDSQQVTRAMADKRKATGRAVLAGLVPKVTQTDVSSA